MLDECTEGIVLQQSNLVDSTVTLHLHLVVRNKRWNSLQVEQEAERTIRFLKNRVVRACVCVHLWCVCVCVCVCVWDEYGVQAI